MMQTYRVLILEDDADSAEELQLKLEQLGYAVVRGGQHRQRSRINGVKNRV